MVPEPRRNGQGRLARTYHGEARSSYGVPVSGGYLADEDDCPRPGTTLDAVSALKPVFREKGSVTAGNSCPLNDGAAALVITSDVRARELGLQPLARIISTGVAHRRSWVSDPSMPPVRHSTTQA